MLSTNQSLTIKTYDYNVIAQDADFIRVLRLLTLGGNSGMNHELDSFEFWRHSRRVDVKIFTAHYGLELVGWALLSNEPSSFCFMREENGFKPEFGSMFQVYVNPTHRRKGVASELLRVANQHADGKKLCVCPWDEASTGFYTKNKPMYEAKYL